MVAGLSILATVGILTWTSTDEVDSFAARKGVNSYRLTSIVIDDSKLTLAWNGEAEKYRVRIGTNLKKPLLDTTTSDPIASLNSLNEKTSRSGKLRYRIDSLKSSEPTTVLDGTLTLPPDTIGKPKVHELASNGLALRWDEIANVSNYDISFSTGPDNEPFETHRIPGDRPEFVINTLEPEFTAHVRVRAVRDGVLGEFGPAAKFTTSAEFSDFAVGAWNVCSESCKGYGSRSIAQAHKVHEAKMDIMTLQEAGGQRVGRTTNAAFSGGERGFVRASGGAKTRYIFYRDELFDQLAGGTFSIGHSRTVTWARLVDKKTDQPFIVASIHLSPGKNGKKDRVRGSQAANLVSGVKRINPSEHPVILAGDFNTGRHRGGDRVFGRLGSAGYRDSVSIAKTSEGANMNTYNRNSASPRRSGDRVDHIFVSADFEVPLWRQYNHTHNGKVLTDHNMIAAKVRLKRETGGALDEPTQSILLPTATSNKTTHDEHQP